jgi:ubiquinone/menaquinone biosynthesis C-methylase UbiE
MEKDYWIKFWNEDEIINCDNLQNQIGRTIKKTPISEDNWQFTLSFIAENLELRKEDDLLDLCAGNGLISIPFSKICNSVTSVDISNVLIEKINSKGCPNIKTIIADARDLDFEQNSFSKIIIYFAIQHFSEQETILLFEKLNRWLRPGGILLIGDVPDISKLWDFFNDKVRQKAYIDSIKFNKPIIGTWFTKEFLSNLAFYSGFKECFHISQPEQLINHTHRFDIIMKN